MPRRVSFASAPKTFSSVAESATAVSDGGLGRPAVKSWRRGSGVRVVTSEKYNYF
jgi:hypothetical protein